MKRLISVLLAVSVLFTLVACGTRAIPDDHNSGLSAPMVDQIPVKPSPDVTVPSTEDDTAEILPQGEKTQPRFRHEMPRFTPVELFGSREPEEYVRTVDPSAPMVALTFDDGPHELYSDQIMDVLERYHSVATFFEVGYNARRYPKILTRMAELGCEIASHTYYHHDLTTLSRDAMLTDLAKLDQIIYDATGAMPTLVRPPYGAVNSTVKYQSGRAMILWTVDTQDWRYRDAQTLIDYIQNYGDLDGEVVLMHSIHASTAEAMEVVVPWLIEQGYQLVTVSELMAYYYGELLEPNQCYNQTWFARHGRTEYPLELPDEPMQTNIPAYTTVPVVPNPPKDDTPEQPDVPETPQDGADSGEQPEQGEVPPSEPQEPSDEPVQPPEETGGTPGEDPNGSGEDIPPENDDTATGEDASLPDGGESAPPEDNGSGVGE